MKSILNTSELFRENEYEIIFLPDSLCEEIDEAIKQSKTYHDRDDFVSSAVERFISDVSDEKILRSTKTH